MLQLRLTVVIFVLMPGLSWGQTALQLPITHYSSYYNESLPAELKRLPADTALDRQIQNILKNGRDTANFTATAANVGSVTAARNHEVRYLLYNPAYLQGLAIPELAYAMLAHEIGHHLNEHQLIPASSFTAEGLALTPAAKAQQMAEELEAARFVGYVLYETRLTRQTFPEVIRLLPLSALDVADQLAALEQGYLRKETYITMAPSAAFQDNGNGEALPGIPEFPFPPPQPSASLDMTDYFTTQTSLGAIAQQLKNALNQCGYYERQYYYIRSGFALVTRIEQYQNDGSSLGEPERWSAQPYRQNESWAAYFRNLFTANPGHFRVFVFIVTDEPLVANTDREVSRQTVESWLREGANRLPTHISEKPRTKDTTVTALIYDFLVEEATNKAQLRLPAALSSNTHLVKSKIINALR